MRRRPVGLFTSLLLLLTTTHVGSGPSPVPAASIESSAQVEDVLSGGLHSRNLIAGRNLNTLGQAYEAFHTGGTLDGGDYAIRFSGGGSTNIGAFWQGCESTPFSSARYDCDRRFNYATFMLNSAAELSEVRVWIGGFNNWALPWETSLRMEVYRGNATSSATPAALIATSNDTLVPHSWPTGAMRTFAFASPVMLFSNTPYTIRLLLPSGTRGDLGASGAYALHGIAPATTAQTCFSLTTKVSPAGGGTITSNAQPSCSSGLLANRRQQNSVSPEQLASAAESTSGPSRAAQTDEVFRKLIEKAAGGRSIRVIVGLNVIVKPEGVLRNPLQVRSQRADIAQAQVRVLSDLSSSRVASVKKFPDIPFMALETDAAGLVRLKSSSSVRGVSEDLPAAPSTSESVTLIGAPAAWSAGYSGAGQTVAILDTGVDKSHPFLAGKVVSEACYSTNSAIASSLCPGGVEETTESGSGSNCPPSVTGCEHGTHVAGIAAGKSNGAGSGVARDANVISIQVFSRLENQSDCGDPLRVRAPCLGAYASDYIMGLQRVRALSGDYDIAAVNLSLGSGRYAQHCDTSNETNAAITAAIDNLKSLDIATIISAGNEGHGDGLNMPACISSAVSVGSTDDGSSYCHPELGCFPTQVDTVSAFARGGSNVASHLDLFAPGNSIYSSIPAGFDPNIAGPSFADKQGTSMAAPHVAGAWAVLKSKFPSATVAQILEALRHNGVPIRLDALGIDVPRIKVDAALNALAADRYRSGTAVTLTPAPAAGYVFQGWIGCDNSSGSNCTVTMSSDKTVTAKFLSIQKLRPPPSKRPAIRGRGVSKP